MAPSVGERCFIPYSDCNLSTGGYDNGVLYSSPLSGIFDTRETVISLSPVLLAIYMHGQKMDVGNGGLSSDAPYVEHLDLDYDDNDLTFLFSAMKYVQLKQGGMAITDVAEATGFSSPSYFSKCFQKEYGCKPSEYLRNDRE